jgi:hypothetical protein
MGLFVIGGPPLMPRGAAILVIRAPFRLPQATSDRGAQSNTPTFPRKGRLVVTLPRRAEIQAERRIAVKAG